MFDSVLIANRGEIAVRIIRTLRRLGIRSIAVYSDADAGARHVELADTAVGIGPAAAAESYLSIEAILDAARRTGAQAIHPGYGFLSENAAFARACAEAGIVFIGPDPEAIEAMADKIVAKQRVAAAGVPTVPGSDGSGLDDAALAAEADRIGFPLLIKPSAGGGGKGMQVVASAAELPPALASARRVAAASFGDDTLLLERLIERPRHIEVQVMADRHGSVLSLGERECSLQRRHQKVVEEAPSPLLDDETRERIGAAARDVARSVDYVGAGTVEFLVSDLEPDTFFFIEMNTRLQVEHPVTEAVTGLDLVELQLRVAAGEPLPLGQEDVRITGHAIEARVYAESPVRGFLPATGRVLALDEPAGEGMRLDSGLRSGLEVSGDYDPMLAKAIGVGADREHALARLDALLAGLVVLGVETNTGYLRGLLADPDVAAGRLDTGLMDRLGAPSAPAPEPADLIAAALAVEAAKPAGESPWHRRDGWRLGGNRPRSHVVAGAELRLGDGAVAVDAGDPVPASLEQVEGSRSRLVVDGVADTVHLAIDGDTVWLHRAGRTLALPCPDRRTRLAQRLAAIERAAHPSSPELRAAMPGTVTTVAVADGDTVEVGTTVLTIEAMKMEHPVTAPVAGIVRLAVAAGEGVRLDQVVATIEGPQGRNGDGT